VRVNLKGIHKVNKRLAGGGVATYWYAWRGGPRIIAPPGSAGFLVEYSEAQRTRPTTDTNTLRFLVDEFRDSSEFTGRSASTQRAYKAYLRKIEDEFGELPIAAISDPAVRGKFKTWRDGMAATPRTADYAWTTLARVLSVAKDRGRIPVNPCERGGRLYAPDRTERLWTDAHMAAFSKEASEPLRVALTLALWTGQRQGDLLKLRWTDYDGKRIRLQQGKTGASVSIRVGGPLKVTLDGMKRRGKTILVNTDGKTWTSDGFRSSWAKACARAEIEGLTFHDLRGSAITRLAMAGATPQEIAGVTGHSIADVSAMLDRHYLGDRAALGDKAIKRLERQKKPRPTRVR
jgi:integrase